MPRPLRIQFPGANYQLMNRGDRREPLFRDDQDRRRFLTTLGEACDKTGWQLQAWCRMGNHFHLVAETPQANLVVGMKWAAPVTSAISCQRNEIVDCENPLTLMGARVRIASLPEVDTDGDGLLDNWEYEFGLDPASGAGANGAEGDPDHDGATNAQEQLTGTDPWDARSVFQLTLTTLPASRYALTWRTVVGKRYQLEYADEQITNFTPFLGPNWPRLALSSEESHFDNVSTNQPLPSQRTYRVRLVR